METIEDLPRGFEGWLAEVEYAGAYDWCLGKHLSGVPANRVRLAWDFQPRFCH